MSASDPTDTEPGSSGAESPVEGAALNRSAPVSRYAPDFIKKVQQWQRYGGDLCGAIEMIARILSDLAGGVADGAAAAGKRFRGSK